MSSYVRVPISEECDLEILPNEEEINYTDLTSDSDLEFVDSNDYDTALNGTEDSTDYDFEAMIKEKTPSLKFEEVHDNERISVSRIRYDTLNPISRAPTKPRDTLYAVIFLFQFLLIFLFSIMEKKSLRRSLVNYNDANSWASLLMIVTILGTFVGATIPYLISFIEIRLKILKMSLFFSIILQIALGNVILLMPSDFSYFGIIFLVSAVIDYIRYESSTKHINFTCALIQLAIDIGNVYGISLMIACVFIIVFQTLLLLWWGAFFVGILSEVDLAYGYAVDIAIFVMLISLYWITELFNSFVSFVVGGCILWYFVHEDDLELDPSNRVLLHMQCLLTSSLGSCCKGSLYSPICQLLILLNHWSKTKRNSSSWINYFKFLFQRITDPLLHNLLKYNRLSYCLIATYGRTFCKAAEEQAHNFPESMFILSEDNAFHSLKSVATVIAVIISLLFGFLSNKDEGSSWSLFFVIIFCLSYFGVSIILQVYRSAIDAIIVAFSIKPQQLSIENPIIYSRFVRYRSIIRNENQ